ncbi:hypothetical protein N0A02_02145 [Paraburkholderia acidicola]|uniref:Uncharacterized protein n=1 Tax=Paraburkholderia acidicola TaxID=1912599 RepID=A0ABV1LG24_9BURK
MNTNERRTSKQASVHQRRDAMIALAGFALGLVLAAALTHMPGESTAWAAWIQAFGSIAAIIGSFAVVRYQLKQERARAREEAADRDQRKKNGILELCDLAQEQADAAAGGFQGHVVDELLLLGSYNERFFNETLHALNSLNLYQFGFPEAVSDLIRLKLAYGAIGRAISASRFGDGTEQMTDEALCLDIQASQRLVTEHIQALRQILG